MCERLDFMDPRKDKLHILMLPWLAHGHVSPFLELGKRLSQRNFNISLCSTPVNLSSIKANVCKNTFPDIQLVELQLPSTPDLPPHCHTTKAVAPHLIPALKEALDMAQPSFSNLLKVLNPDLLIYDFVQPWAPAIASKQNIPAILYLSAAACGCSYFYHFSKDPSIEFPFPSIYFHEHESQYKKMLQLSTTSLPDTDRYLQGIERSSHYILIKTFREIEAKYMDYLSPLLGKELLPVGPLAQEATCEDEHSTKFLKWLNVKDKRSVVFVSFGSEYFMSKDEIEEIAYGLELCKVNFIWVIRFHEGEHVKEIDEVLPKGLVGRVGERGMFVKDWGPQGHILSHCSTGGFVSHCGWGSVIEGMKYGVPIIAMPMHLDQPLNARLVEELGVGMEVKRDKDGDGKYVRGEVARMINDVVVEKEGDEVRRKAKELSDTIRMKGEGEMDIVAEKLKDLCLKSGKRNM